LGIAKQLFDTFSLGYIGINHDKPALSLLSEDAPHADVLPEGVKADPFFMDSKFNDPNPGNRRRRRSSK
jgi:hypothetical protein